MSDFDWTQRITDRKPTGWRFPKPCPRCGQPHDAVVRLTFKTGHGKSEDKYVCHPCTEELCEGRAFNIFQSEVRP